ncbi:hypothetical protein NMY22_g14505 [Coprinellus aureogranulatus]|nr:hypothetical protein NMY22_g14505 [Coprinellus aureogranulatus]
MDAHDYDIDQLLFGTMLFTLVAFLSPTAVAFYFLFAGVRLLTLLFQACLEILLAFVNSFPLFLLVLKMKDSKRIPASIVLRPVDLSELVRLHLADPGEVTKVEQLGIEGVLQLESQSRGIVWVFGAYRKLWERLPQSNPSPGEFSLTCILSAVPNRLQELANPHVHSKLLVYPQDSGPWLSEACQAKQWLHKLSNKLTTLYMEIGPTGNKKVFFTNKPAFITGRQFCVPVQWAEQKDGPNYAPCWHLQPVFQDNHIHWQAVTSTTYKILVDNPLKPFPELKANMIDCLNLYHAPGTIYQINEMYDETTGVSSPWPLTWSDNKGSVWCQMSGGKPVYFLLIYLYCNDTSENKLKKWNKHNL